jgi:hypothetical protein
VGKDNKGVYMALVLVHDSPLAARDNIEILKQRLNTITLFNTQLLWKDRISDISIQSEGSVLMAKLYPPKDINSGYWAGWVFQSEPLILHE